MRSKRQSKVPQKLVDSNYFANISKPNSHKIVSKKEKSNVVKDNIGDVGEGAKCDGGSRDMEEMQTTVNGIEEGEKIEWADKVVNEKLVNEVVSKVVLVVSATDKGRQYVNKDPSGEHVSSNPELNVNKSTNGVDKGVLGNI